MGSEMCIRDSDKAPRATLVMPASRMSVLDGLPIDDAEPEDDQLVVTLPVSSPRWLEQLLLRIGPGVSLRDVGELDVNVASAATSMLGRYGILSS